MTLRDIIEAAGGTLDVNTVLAAKNDPYRLDTPAGHVLGQWFKDQLALHPEGTASAIFADCTMPF